MLLSFRPAATLSSIDMVGNGVGFWNTIPIRRRTCTGSTARRVDIFAVEQTSPVAVAPGTTSCIRLRQRTSVDLPQPDGPDDRRTAILSEVQADIVQRFVLVEVSAQMLDD
jgi:hypothetical protein